MCGKMDIVESDLALLYAQAQSAITLGRVNSTTEKTLRSYRFGIMDMYVNNVACCWYVICGDRLTREGDPVVECVGFGKDHDDCLDKIKAWFRIGSEAVTCEAAMGMPGTIISEPTPNSTGTP